MAALSFRSFAAAPPDADMNGDGMVNVVDIQLVTSAVLGCGYATH
jgi:hypothetical protein